MKTSIANSAVKEVGPVTLETVYGLAVATVVPLTLIVNNVVTSCWCYSEFLVAAINDGGCFWTDGSMGAVSD